MQRITGLLILEVRNSNPNGDPDRESDPRQRPNDGRGEISPVSFKRKVRDLIEDKAGPAWAELSARFNPPLPSAEFHVLESRGRDRAAITKEANDGTLAAKYWDARLFGTTFLEEKTKEKASYIRTGVCQFGLGLSISAIDVTRHTLTNKAGVDKDLDRGMAPLAFRVVQHGLYALPFFVNPSTAHRSGCTQRDVDLLLHALPYAYSNNPAMNRAGISPVHIHVLTHTNALGSFNDFTALDALTPKRKGDNPLAPSTSLADYDFPVIEAALSPFVGKLTHRDLAL